MTTVGAVVFAALYVVTIHDSKFATIEITSADAAGAPAPGRRLFFAATAYCKGVVTTSGVAAQSGVAAADPLLLPVGSVVQLSFRDGGYDGMYTVLDTGPLVQGRQIDIYMWNCNEAMRFGRQDAQLTVLRLGWNPRAATPGIIDRLFRRQAAAKPPLPSRPLPLSP